MMMLSHDDVLEYAYDIYQLLKMLMVFITWQARTSCAVDLLTCLAVATSWVPSVPSCRNTTHFNKVPDGFYQD